MADDIRRNKAVLQLGLAALSFAAGSSDAFALVQLGGVFTSTMSGNTVMLGLWVGRGHVAVAANSGASFVGHVAGVLVATPLMRRTADKARALAGILAAEIVFLVAFAALWFAAGRSSAPHGAVIFALLLLAAAAWASKSSPPASSAWRASPPPSSPAR